MHRALVCGAAVAALCFSTPGFAQEPVPPIPPNPPAGPSIESPPAPPKPKKPDFDPEVAAKLSGEQMTEILIERAKANDDRAIEYVAVVGAYAMVIGIALALAYLVFRMNRARHETIRLAIEKGVFRPEMLAPVPAAMIDLRRGILLSGLGVGLSLLLFFVVPDQRQVAAVGLLPLAVGVGYLVSWRVLRASA